MGLEQFLSDLATIESSAAAAFDAAADDDQLESARIEYLGAKGGKLRDAQKGLGKVDKPDKPAAGKRFNEVKQQIEAAFAAAQERLVAGKNDDNGASGFDPTIPGQRLRLGHVHPITQTICELKGHHGAARLHAGRRTGNRG